jgi:hypothetical protein
MFKIINKNTKLFAAQYKNAVQYKKETVQTVIF